MLQSSNDLFELGLQSSLNHTNPIPATYYLAQEFCSSDTESNLCELNVFSRWRTSNPNSIWPYLTQIGRVTSREELDDLLIRASNKTVVTSPWGDAIGGVFESLASTEYAGKSDLDRLLESMYLTRAIARLQVFGPVNNACTATTNLPAIEACIRISELFSENSENWSTLDKANRLLSDLHSAHSDQVSREEVEDRMGYQNSLRPTLAYANLGPCTMDSRDYLKLLSEHGEMAAIQSALEYQERVPTNVIGDSEAVELSSKNRDSEIVIQDHIDLAINAGITKGAVDKSDGTDDGVIAVGMIVVLICLIFWFGWMKKYSK